MSYMRENTSKDSPECQPAYRFCRWFSLLLDWVFPYRPKYAIIICINMNHYEYIPHESNIDRLISTGRFVQRVFDDSTKSFIHQNTDIFSGVYSPEEIKKDNEHMDALKQSFIQDLVETDNLEAAKWKKAIERRKDKDKLVGARTLFFGFKVAKILESLIPSHYSHWFGPEAEILPVTEFDDFVNKIDALVKFNNKKDGPILGIDFTKSHHLGKKFLLIKEKIDEGKLSRIKYFFSKKLNEKGPRPNIPRVIVGTNANLIIELAQEWVSEEKGGFNESVTRYIVLTEICEQLQAYYNYADSLGQDEIAEHYKKALDVVEPIWHSFVKRVNSEQVIMAGERDSILLEMRRHLQGFRTE